MQHVSYLMTDMFITFYSMFFLYLIRSSILLVVLGITDVDWCDFNHQNIDPLSNQVWVSHISEDFLEKVLLDLKGEEI